MNFSRSSVLPASSQTLLLAVHAQAAAARTSVGHCIHASDLVELLVRLADCFTSTLIRCCRECLPLLACTAPARPHTTFSHRETHPPSFSPCPPSHFPHRPIMRRLSRLLLVLGVASLAAASKADIFNKLATEQQPHQDGEGVEAVAADNITGEEAQRDLQMLSNSKLFFATLANPSMAPSMAPSTVPETLIPSLATSCPGIELKAPRTIRAGRQVSAGRHVYMVAKLTSHWDMAGGLRDGGLILTLPDGLNYVGAVISPMAPGYGIHPEVSGQTVAWTALDLAPGKAFKFRLELKVLPIGPAVRTLVGQATVDGSICGRNATVEVKISKEGCMDTMRQAFSRGHSPSLSYNPPSTHPLHNFTASCQAHRGIDGVGLRRSHLSSHQCTLNLDAHGSIHRHHHQAPCRRARSAGHRR